MTVGASALFPLSDSGGGDWHFMLAAIALLVVRFDDDFA
jgi:hypothetical protein